MSGPVLYLPSDPKAITSTRWQDMSGYGNHGKVHGAKPVQIAPGLMGYEFDGVDDYIDCGNDMSLSGFSCITLVAWIVPNVLTDVGMVISKAVANEYDLYRKADTGNDAKKIDCRFEGLDHPDIVSIITTNIGEIAFIGGSWDGSAKNTWVNESYRTVPNTGALSATLSHLFIGARDNKTLYFHGIIAEARIYPYTLTASQIKGIYHSSPLYKLQRGLYRRPVP